MNTAFEMITGRTAWHTAEALPTYRAVMIDASGLYALADGTGAFVGIVQYPAAKANDVATVVTGAFPALATEEIEAGDKLTIDADVPGKFRIADTPGDVVIGVALSGAAIGDLFTIQTGIVNTVIPED